MGLTGLVTLETITPQSLGDVSTWAESGHAWSEFQVPAQHPSLFLLVFARPRGSLGMLLK